MSSNFHSFSPNALTGSEYSYEMELVAGDTLGELTVLLKDQECFSNNVVLEDMEPLSLVDFLEANLRVREIGTTTVLVTVTGGVVFEPATDGKLVMRIPAGTFDGFDGEYEGELEITYTTGQISTVQDLIKFTIRAGF